MSRHCCDVATLNILCYEALYQCRGGCHDIELVSPPWLLLSDVMTLQFYISSVQALIDVAANIVAMSRH